MSALSKITSIAITDRDNYNALQRAINDLKASHPGPRRARMSWSTTKSRRTLM
jgi:hypothetical protein